jgi:hypothetical protein
MASVAEIDGLTVPLDPILDTGAGANANFAYSVRLLRSAYTGNCLRVRRTSDNTTQDIGFVGGLVDTSSIATFCGSSDGFVDLWYDQSPGTQVNAPQTASGAQPKIYDGVNGIQEENGKPALLCPFGLYGFDFGANTINTTGVPASAIILARNTNLESINYIHWSNSLSANMFWGGTNGTVNGLGFQAASGNPSGFYTSTIEDTTTQHTGLLNTVTTSDSFYVDGAAESGAPNTLSNFNTQFLGYRDLSFGAFTGHLQEMIFFTGTKSATDASDLHDDIALYYGF